MEDETPRRSFKGPLTGLLLAICAVGLGLGIIGWIFDPAALKPALTAAVEKATGRTLTVSGRIGLGVSMTPLVTLDDVALSNPPGFSRPDFIRAERVELRLAFAPLLERRIEILQVRVTRPDILLETSASGRPNWVFDRPFQLASSRAPTPAASSPRMLLTVHDIVLDNAHVAWSLPGMAGQGTLDAPATAISVDGGAIGVKGALNYDNKIISVRIQTGKPDGTAIGGRTDTVPVAIQLESDGASISAQGYGTGAPAFQGVADVVLPEPGAWTVLQRWRALHGVTFHGQIGDGLSLSVLNLTIASADAGRGARLDAVSVTGRAENPLRVTARLEAFGHEAGIEGDIGDLAWLNGGAHGPVTIDLAANAASARASVKGRIEAPSVPSGYALDVALDAPDPSLVFESAPPGLRAVAVRARLTDTPGPVPFRLTSSAGDVSGDITVSAGARPRISGAVASRRLALDDIRPVAGAARAGGASDPATRGPVIPDTPLPLVWARAIDADLRFHFDHIFAGGVDVAGVDGVLRIDDGLARLDSISIASPGFALHGMFEADTASNPPLTHLAFDAPAFGLAPLLSLLSLPAAATGTANLRADLMASGATLRAQSASLSGWSGLALRDGTIDTATVNAWLAAMRPLHLDGAGLSSLTCLAARANVAAGVVSFDPLTLSTPAALVEGGGEADLGRETLALRLRPRARIGGTGFAVPVRVGGTFRAPQAKLDLSPGPGLLAGLVIGGKDVMNGADPCPDALARAVAPGPALQLLPTHAPATDTRGLGLLNVVLAWLQESK